MRHIQLISTGVGIVLTFALLALGMVPDFVGCAYLAILAVPIIVD